MTEPNDYVRVSRDGHPTEPEPRYINIEKMFATGQIIEIHGTFWKVKRADIKFGNPGGVNLKLASMSSIERTVQR